MISSENYILVNTETGEGFVLDRTLWLRALSVAREQGWSPEGTLYDFSYVVEEQCDPRIPRMMNLFTVIAEHAEHLAWNRNYEEKRDQVVSGEDAYYMGLNLQGITGMQKLVEFLNKGAFRILSF